MQTRKLGTVPVVYRDLDSFEELGDRMAHGVHAFCFVDDQLVIVYSEGKGYWTPPGGGVEPGETAEEAIVREVLEETNMRVLKQRIIGYQEVTEPHRLSVQVRAVCIVEPVGPFVEDADSSDGEGVTEMRLINPADIKQYFDWGEIGEHLMRRALALKAELQPSGSFALAHNYLGKEVEVVMDRPLGSKHPKHGFVYEANYGYVPDTKAPDGEELDAYYLGVQEPLAKASGICIAIAHRKDNDDDKLIVVPSGVAMTDGEIMAAIHFQEQWFDTELVRK